MRETARKKKTEKIKGITVSKLRTRSSAFKTTLPFSFLNEFELKADVDAVDNASKKKIFNMRMFEVTCEVQT